MAFDFRLTWDRAEWDGAVVQNYLVNVSYWWADRAQEKIATTWETSLCVAALHQTRTIGFARIVTDQVTIAYLCDVFVLPEFQGKGVGNALVKACLQHPETQTCVWRLGTRDAHELYQKYGFSKLADDSARLGRDMVRSPVAKQPL